MPKLILFAPCEKVVVDQNDNTTSLISLLEAVNVAASMAGEANIPDDAVVPVNWSLLALWQEEAGDKDKQFESRFTIRFSSGKEINLNVAILVKFEPGKPNFRNILRVIGLPLTQLLQTDLCTVQAFIREHGVGAEWEPMADFPIIIRHEINKS